MITFEVDDYKNMNSALRRFLDYLGECGVDEDYVYDSRLVSCELITNVLRHCGGSACFSGTFSGGMITITVRASTPNGEITIPDLPGVLSESGRGLYIINAISGGNVHIVGGDVTVTLFTDGKNGK
ncbi:MAG: ATP-binding protein [Clostridia bacterium]|nr:ATP-binding protein [Clostridia bacterium]